MEPVPHLDLLIRRAMWLFTVATEMNSVWAISVVDSPPRCTGAPRPPGWRAERPRRGRRGGDGTPPPPGERRGGVARPGGGAGGGRRTSPACCHRLAHLCLLDRVCLETTKEVGPAPNLWESSCFFLCRIAVRPSAAEVGHMNLLVLGGTVFLSREVAAEALRRGHDVTCACRGVSGDVPDGATLLPWDRAEDPPAAWRRSTTPWSTSPVAPRTYDERSVPSRMRTGSSCRRQRLRG